MNLINLPPDAASLMESTRAIGYSLPTAVADIIDNSIAAQAARVEIFYSAAEKYVAILDDGCGMSGDELTRAMKYGGISPLAARDKNDLGRFGLGMKTAFAVSMRSLNRRLEKGRQNICAAVGFEYDSPNKFLVTD